MGSHPFKWPFLYGTLGAILLTQLTIDLLNHWLGRCNDLKSAAAIKAAADSIRKMEGQTAITSSTGE
jgi:hypothetical protein